MFDLQRFLEGLDLLYASGKGREAEGYLKRGLKEAASCGDDGAILAILNELMGRDTVPQGNIRRRKRSTDRHTKFTGGILQGRTTIWHRFIII